MAVLMMNNVQGGAASGPIAAVITAIDRLSLVVQEETQLLRDSGDVDFEKLNHQKNFGLLELTRAMRVLPPADKTPMLVTRLRTLRGLLDDNQRMLKLHLTAADEIATIVANSIHDAASDGTYSSNIVREARR